MHSSWRFLFLAVALGSLGCATGQTGGFGGDDTSGQGGTAGNTSSGQGGSGGVTTTTSTSWPCGTDCTQIQTPDCQQAQCNEQLGQCEVVPAADGDSCEDGLFCTVKDTCKSGMCEGGSANDCGMTPAACQDVVCNEDQKGCSTTGKQNGAACIASNLCEVSATCQNGLCIGQKKDCFFSPVPDDCHVSECNPQNGQCEPVVGNEGQICTDINDLCTVNKTCAAGVCQGGMPKDCSYLTVGCVMGVCDAMSGQCTTNGVNDGDPCDDLDSCTTGEICGSGNCSGGMPITQCVGNDSCCPAGCTEINDIDCALPFNQSQYAAVMTFKDQLSSTTMTMAWDGTNLWTSTGGSSSGQRLAQYTANGVLVQKYSPGLDFRSVFTKGDGTSPVYARSYANMQVRVQTSPGVFGTEVTLAGSLDSQSAVVWDAKNSVYVGRKDGNLYRWNASGGALPTVTLVGYGTLNNEGSSPQDRNVATVKGFYLSYSGGVLSAWDDLGTRIDTTILTGAGTNSNSYYSLGYAQGKVWVIDTSAGTWRGYNVGL